MTRKISSVVLSIFVILILIFGFSEVTQTVIKADQVWGNGRDQDSYYIITAQQHTIPASAELISNMSDNTYVNVDYIVIYEENKLFKNQQKLIKTLRFEREFPPKKQGSADTKYYKLVDEVLEDIDDQHSAFIRVYEEYDQSHNLWKLELVPMIIPKAQTVGEAKQWIKGSNPDLLKLLPRTMVDQEVLNQWDVEHYDPIHEYTNDSPKGFIISSAY